MSQQQHGEKTEKATPKRKRDAREKGQVFKSTEVIASFSMLVMFSVFALFGTFIVQNTGDMLTEMFSGAYIQDVVTLSGISNAFRSAVRYFFIIIAPLFIAAFLSAIIFNIIQVGFLFSPQAIQPKLEKISMAKGLKRLFSSQTVMQLLKSLFKISIIVIVGYNAYKTEFGKFPELMGQNVIIGTQQAFKIILNVAFKVVIFLAILAPVDYWYQWWKYNKDLRMTKQEVKDEYKLSEGDPQIKGKIRQKQRQMSQMRMMQAVEEADVIITNPTHYAIGLKYDENENDAPVVIAKGKDFLAQKLKERAKELDIVMVENRPLAQSLYVYCEVGDEVPEDLYQAVAEILAYVYNLKKKMGRR